MSAYTDFVLSTYTYTSGNKTKAAQACYGESGDCCLL